MEMKAYMQTLLKKLRLLPVLIIVASLAFIVRIGDAYVSAKSLAGEAQAEEAANPESAAEKTVEKDAGEAPAAEPAQPSAEGLKSADAAETAKGEEAPADAASSATDSGPDDVTLPSTEDAASAEESGAVPEAESASGKKWQDASDTDIENSTIKKEMFDDLAKRRNDIEGKEKKLEEREALIEAAQKEVDRKIKEMEGLRDELQGLLKQQTGEQAARVQSLVKIYSGMKPKDAARIFDTLDTDILMEVIGSMPESKAAPIIALMSADRAKALTTLLAEQKKLPDLP